LPVAIFFRLAWREHQGVVEPVGLRSADGAQDIGLGLVENDLDRLRLGHRRAVRLLGHIHASRLDQSDDLTNPTFATGRSKSRKPLILWLMVARSAPQRVVIAISERQR
jgi:hypothetical protein